MVSFFDCWPRCHSLVTKDPHRLLASSFLDFSLQLSSLSIYVHLMLLWLYQSSPSTHSLLLVSFHIQMGLLVLFTSLPNHSSHPTSFSLSLSLFFRIYIQIFVILMNCITISCIEHLDSSLLRSLKKGDFSPTEEEKKKMGDERKIIKRFLSLWCCVVHIQCCRIAVGSPFTMAICLHLTTAKRKLLSYKFSGLFFLF